MMINAHEYATKKFQPLHDLLIFLFLLNFQFNLFKNRGVADHLYSSLKS